MKFKINAGSLLETVTPKEMDEGVRRALVDAHASWFEEMARGMKSLTPSASGSISSASADFILQGPAAGFVWAIQALSVENLDSADVLSVYRYPHSPSTFLGEISGSGRMLKLGSHGLVLRGGESLEVTGASLTATGQLTVNAQVTEVPEFMIWKVL